MTEAYGLNLPDKKIGATPATGLFEIGKVTPSEDKYARIDPGTWEYEFAAKSPTAYATARVAGDIIPFGWLAFPDARKEFERMSSGMKTLDIGLDVAVVLPWTRLFKGAKTLAQTGKMGPWMAKRLATPELKSLSVAEQAIPVGSKFEVVPLVEKVKTKWKLGTDEAIALLEETSNPALWVKAGRSGAFIPREASKGFKARFTPKGKLKEKVKERLKYWVETPEGVQQADFYKELWKKEILKRTSKSINLDEMFEYQLKTFAGHEKLLHAGLEHASARTMANLFVQAIDQPRFISRVLDIGYGWITPTIFLPARKGFGSGEAFFGTNKIFNKIKGHFSETKKYISQQVVNYQERMVAAKLGKFITKGKDEGKRIVGFKKGKSLTKERWNQYGVVAREIDQMTMKGASEQAIATFINENADDVVRKILFDVHMPFFDDLYKDGALRSIKRMISEEGLTPRGAAEFKRMWEGDQGLAAKISSLFSPKYDPTGRDKNLLMHSFLSEVRGRVTKEWFVKRNPKEAAQRWNKLMQGLTPTKGKQIGFPNYLENYTARMRVNNLDAVSKKASALGTKHAGYVKARMEQEAKDQFTDISRIIEARVAGQAKELNLYPYLPGELKKIGDLPEGYRKFFDYWLSRMSGEAAEIDFHMAQWLTKTTGGVMRLFGKPEIWNTQRVAQLGHTINDLTYLGGLGFKPYSAIRNTFQTILTVPTDLGGVKDFYWLFKGYKRGLRKSTQTYMQKNGMVAEYTEELALNPQVLRFGPKIAGKQLPTMQALRDAGMWMFKGADRFNRYTTGGATLEKWEHLAGKFLTPGAKYSPKTFMKKMNFTGREDWIRRELEGIFSKLPKRPSSIKEIDQIANQARDKFVFDVVADTQYLYGVAEAPTIAGRWGVISKTGVIFQSWWMNYATALEKWFFRTGTLGQKGEKFFTALASSAVAGELMVHGAGFKEGQALKSTFAGPFPSELSGFMVPPTWSPFYNALGVVANLAKLDPENAKRRFKALTRSGYMFVPGGLQLGKMIRGTQEEGWEGLARSITNYYGGTGERFLIGR